MRKRLTTEQALLEKELRKTHSSLVETTVPAGETSGSAEEPELETRASLITMIEDQAAIAGELELRYNTILAALERVRLGTYGYCRICEQPIEIDRLEANPSAETCKTHLNN